tara:strand:+ start:360 stop:2252 length:1893 start_codon:yes stop_codon:yes gene_type:complete
MVNIEFPDGSKKEFDKDVTGLDIATSIAEGLARSAVAIEVNGELQDLSTKIDKDSKIKIITFKDEVGVEIFRHSSAHILADAVVQLFPKAKPTIGPAVDDGFYYDFDMEAVKEKDLEKIEQKMKEIVKVKLPFVRSEISKDEALEMFKDNKFKVEMINELEGDTVTIYKHGEYVDMCRGSHVQHTGQIKSFKLMKVAGAYWRADAEKEQLQRIYGISFPDKKELKAYLTLLEEAKKRDHRKIGREMNLFSFHDEAPGMPFFHDRGHHIWKKLASYMRKEMRKLGYEDNKTPIILNKALWLQSGHWDHYKENMYFTKIDKQDYAVKPMNCPGNLIIYKTKMHSYRELPIKAGEFGLVHRHELSGVLSGLFRVRHFTQDDAHVFCTEEQLEEQIIELIELVDRVYKTFGFDYNVELSTKPEKAMGSKEIWDKAEKALENALKKKQMKFKINPGDGAFYGPKIDYHLKDALGRTWQCGTIQLDFSMPEKFDLTYEAQDGTKKRPVMLHRAIYGSVERFLGVLVEHYAGKFPLWLSPEQVRVLPIADRHHAFAEKVYNQLFGKGFQVTKDFRAETTGKKIRDAEIDKVNYTFVIGDKEIENKTVNVRTRDNKILGEEKVSDFIKELEKEINEKK